MIKLYRKNSLKDALINLIVKMVGSRAIGRVLRKFLLHNRVLEDTLDDRLLATIEFCQSWEILSRVVQTDKMNTARQYNVAKARLRNKNDVKDRLLDLICEGNDVFLANGVMRFPDRHSLWTLIHEILINEDYFFETDTASPYIVDCGTHFGLAIYYFKSIYPQARVRGFEPVPEMRELALENIHNNNYVDVDIFPYALSDAEKQATFLVSESYSMAGSLTDRRRHFGDNIVEITVECRKLSEYLNEPVHFLKMDIEGLEDKVLAEAEPFLGNVQQLVCEYHHGMGLASDRLGKILLLLDRAGFDTHVSKSTIYQRRALHRPMALVDQPYSAIIWAKNRNWSDCYDNK
jgi:FkbM family methyltransferase